MMEEQKEPMVTKGVPARDTTGSPKIKYSYHFLWIELFSLVRIQTKSSSTPLSINKTSGLLCSCNGKMKVKHLSISTSAVLVLALLLLYHFND